MTTFPSPSRRLGRDRVEKKAAAAQIGAFED